MVERFIFWLKAINFFEPMPDEIKCLLFVVIKNGKYAYLELRGFEKIPGENDSYYRPQEAEFFYSKELTNIDERLLIHRVKYLISEAFSDEVIKQIYRKEKVYLKYDNIIEYLFYN